MKRLLLSGSMAATSITFLLLCLYFIILNYKYPFSYILLLPSGIFLMVYISTASVFFTTLDFIFTKERFMVLTKSKIKLTGTHINYQDDYLILIEKEVSHYVKMSDIVKYSIVTKAEGKVNLTIEEFLKRYPKQ